MSSLRLKNKLSYTSAPTKADDVTEDPNSPLTGDGSVTPSVVLKHDEGDGEESSQGRAGVAHQHRTSQCGCTCKCEMIPPENKYIKYWDILIVFMCIYTIFSVPFEIGVAANYCYGPNETPCIVRGCITASIFFTDTILVFFRQFYAKRGRLVRGQKEIAMTYLKGWFTIDLIACFPGDVLIYGIGQDYESDDSMLVIVSLLRMCRILRLRRIPRHNSSLQDHFLRLPSSVTNLTLFVILIIVLNHWMACLWSLTAVLEAGGIGEPIFESLPPESNWISKYMDGSTTALEPTGVSFSSCMQRYILALYWSVMTTTSIGYGDVTPTAVAEYYVNTAAMFVGGVLWAYIIGAACGFAVSLHMARDQFFEKLDIANAILHNNKNFKKHDHFEKEVREFLLANHRYLRDYKGLIDRKQELVESFSDGLRKRFITYEMETHIFSVPYLKGLEDEDVLFDLANNMTTKTFYKHENFYLDGSCIYIASTGMSLLTRHVGHMSEDGKEVTISSVHLMFSGSVIGATKILLSENSNIVFKLSLLVTSFATFHQINKESIERALKVPSVWKKARWYIAKAQLMRFATMKGKFPMIKQ